GDNPVAVRILGLEGNVEFPGNAFNGACLGDRSDLGPAQGRGRRQFIGVFGVGMRVFGDLADDFRGGIVIFAKVGIVLEQLGFKQGLEIVGKSAIFFGVGGIDDDL